MSVQNIEYLTLNLENNTYEVQILYKKIKNIYFSFNNGKIFIKAPLRYKRLGFASLYKLIEPNLLKLIHKKKKNVTECNSYYTNDYLYFLGKKYDIESNYVTIFGYKYHINSVEDFYKKIFPVFNEIFSKRFEYYKSIMRNTMGYIYSFKKVKSFYGCNHLKTKEIVFSFILMHYSMDIIDSVIVHEFGHCVVKNHSQKFYDVLLKTMPDYKMRDKKLKLGDYSWTK